MSQNMLQEMINTLRSSKSQLAYVEQQLFQLNQQEGILKKTLNELDDNNLKDTKIWRSCGRGFLKQDKSIYVEDLMKNNDTLAEHMKALDIKKNYLTTTIEKTVDNMKKHTK